MEPIAYRLRPETLEEMVGQSHILNKNGLLFQSIKKKRPFSFILWGPPGCGKTTLALAYAKAFHLDCVHLSAVSTGIADLKKILEERQKTPLFHGQFILFLDEIHRYNKAQQDFLLPFVEKGSFYLIGATTENPSFYLNAALLSRLRVFRMDHLHEKELEQIIDRYLAFTKQKSPSKEVRNFLIYLSQGDARYLLNLLENLEHLPKPHTVESIKKNLPKREALFDKQGDQHYNLISALHKSLRGSDPQAGLYWLARMLEGGEDRLYILRRLIRFATEDIGLADPQALMLSIAAHDAYTTLGSPEGELAIAELVVYLAAAPKSNSVYTALPKALDLAKETSHLNPPMHILNAPTQLMKNFGYGKGYIYDHDTPEKFSGQNYFPDGVKRQNFYTPGKSGFEKNIKLH